MADFTALKTAIQTYIKQNGNEEITGAILQEVLLSVVTTLGDGAINDLITALADEVAARQNADVTLQQNITNEATARGNADTALQGLINGVKNNVDNGYVYAGIAIPSTTPVTGKVFYLALTAGTYTNFGSTVVSQGINILKYNGSTWSVEQVWGVDDEPTVGSNNLVKSCGVYSALHKEIDIKDKLIINAFISANSAFGAVGDLNTSIGSGDYKTSEPIKILKGESLRYKSKCGATGVAFIVAQYSNETADSTSFISGIDTDTDNYVEGVISFDSDCYIRIAAETSSIENCYFELNRNLFELLSEQIQKNTDDISNVETEIENLENGLRVDSTYNKDIIDTQAFILNVDGFQSKYEGDIISGDYGVLISDPIECPKGSVIKLNTCVTAPIAYAIALYSSDNPSASTFIKGYNISDITQTLTINVDSDCYAVLAVQNNSTYFSDVNCVISRPIGSVYSKDIADLKETIANNKPLLDYDYLMIIGSGQSLGAGWGHLTETTKALYASNELMWGTSHRTWEGERSTSDYDNGLHPLKETSFAYGGETSDSKACETIIKDLLRDKALTSIPKFVVCNNSYGGYCISQLKKGTTPYNEMIREIQATKNFCDNIGKTFAVAAVTWTQGEGDNDEENTSGLHTVVEYKAALKKLISDINKDVKVITNQGVDVKLITYQTPTMNIVSQKRIAQVAQYEASYEDKNIILGAVINDSTFQDAYHIDILSTMKMGVRYGAAIANSLKCGYYDSIRPIQAEIDGNDLYITFDIPYPPLKLSAISGLANYGFKVLKNNNDILSSVTLFSDCTLKITCSESPSGTTLQYGYNTGLSAGSTDALCGLGGLSDSMQITINYNNNDVVVDNPSPTYEVLVSTLKG